MNVLSAVGKEPGGRLGAQERGEMTNERRWEWRVDAEGLALGEEGRHLLSPARPPSPPALPWDGECNEDENRQS